MGYRIKSRFIYKQVGQRLKQLRNQKGVSQKVVADYLGVDRSTYTNYEMGITGRRNYSCKKVRKQRKISQAP